MIVKIFSCASSLVIKDVVYSAFGAAIGQCILIEANNNNDVDDENLIGRIKPKPLKPIKKFEEAADSLAVEFALQKECETLQTISDVERRNGMSIPGKSRMRNLLRFQMSKGLLSHSLPPPSYHRDGI